MKDFKPRIFIGSSKGSLNIAKIVCSELESFAECKIWQDAFKFSNSTFDELVNMLSLYDYGILIATADDMALFKGDDVIIPRDNIVFEYGLFTGRLGKKRTFLLTEDGTKIPTDLLGITLPFFQRKKGAAQTKALKKSCQAIEEHINNNHDIFDFGFLPSTALAFGYFKNFVTTQVG
jgi:predicted nucleotide-binding protein